MNSRHCGKPINPRSQICGNCGASVPNTGLANTRSSAKRMLLLVVLLIIIIGSFVVLFSTESHFIHIWRRLNNQKMINRISAINMKMAVIENALSRYQMDNGEYPTTAMGLKSLISCPSSISEEDWKGPYLNDPKSLLDSWGNEFLYRMPSTRDGVDYDIISKGADRTLYTKDDAINIVPNHE